IDYLAPELIRGQPASAASDLYALGCVVFECLSGTPPFGHKGVLEVATAHLEDTPGDPCEAIGDAPSGVSWATLTALRKAPVARPPTATAYATMLRIAANRVSD